MRAHSEDESPGSIRIFGSQKGDGMGATSSDLEHVVPFPYNFVQNNVRLEPYRSKH